MINEIKEKILFKSKKKKKKKKYNKCYSYKFFNNYGNIILIIKLYWF